ncbi:DNA repair protein [Conidiobolus coronatus NRRL 28638]|uniref:DNA repair protein n=1 Tax=Conidiobolus coronatus (strain ATCC 28846 / CBS 209.66 / NRRL 28638) TaxID=796925 RepID=A0A137P635_CONC2|nr:DNA repair protein [Conidiobolus coronatus NRRL 28638]|eukprot:KXN70472.1 DNA repair protein [Conidiobolus coronatus NRRL 28638]
MDKETSKSTADKAVNANKNTTDVNEVTADTDKNDTNKSTYNKKRDFASTFETSNYYEFNLTTMKNTKGGFLPADEVQKEQLEKLKPIIINDQLPYSSDPKHQILCKECNDLDIDPLFLQIYDTKVCKPCKEKFPDKYSLLTKTEVREDYLLTESELADRDLFKIWSKPNPRKSTWNNMQLFLREQVEEFAFKKRDKEKAERKDKKYKAKVSDLRKRTRVSTWKNEDSRPKVHEHDFEILEEKTEDDESQRKCKVCGVTEIYEEFFF